MAEYIEREALIEAIDAEFFKTDPGGEAQIGVLSCRSVARTIPTADVVEVKHGRWVEREDFDNDVYYDCSVCRESFCFIEGVPEDNFYCYCPNCGAKMDGE